MPLVSLARLKRWLGIPEADTTRDELLGDALEGAVAVLASLCGRETFAEGTRTERVDGNAKATVYLSHTPITAILSVEFDPELTGLATPLGALCSWSQIGLSRTPPALADIETDRAGGLTRLDRGLWPIGRRNIIAHYTAGYTEATLPHDLRMLICEIVGLMLGRRGKEGVEQVSLSGFDATFHIPEGETILSLAGARAVVARYKRLAVV